MVRLSQRWRPKVIAKHAVEIGATAGPDWRPCVDGLQKALHETAWQNADVSLVISNHFVRYALVPWSDQLSTDVEKEAWVAHQFLELYGEVTTSQEYRWSDDRPDLPCVASAIDTDFIAQIRAVFEPTSLRLRSVQPYLMAAFNRCKRHAKKDSVWLVLPENGRVCIAAISNGQWRAISSRSLGADWAGELSVLLERQLLVAEEDVPAVVLAYSPDVSRLGFVYSGDVPLKIVSPKVLSGFAADQDSPCAMALAGVV